MNLAILPQEIQNILEDENVENMTPLEVVQILESMCICTKSTSFKSGDFIASELAISRNTFIVFQASNSDVRGFSDKKRNYYIFNISSAF